MDKIIIYNRSLKTIARIISENIVNHINGCVSETPSSNDVRILINNLKKYDENIKTKSDIMYDKFRSTYNAQIGMGKIVNYINSIHNDLFNTTNKITGKELYIGSFTRVSQELYNNRHLFNRYNKSISQQISDKSLIRIIIKKTIIDNIDDIVNLNIIDNDSVSRIKTNIEPDNNIYKYLPDKKTNISVEPITEIPIVRTDETPIEPPIKRKFYGDDDNNFQNNPFLRRKFN